VNATRRHFIKLSAGAGIALGLSKIDKYIAEKSVNLCVSSFWRDRIHRPYQVRYALSRDHKVRRSIEERRIPANCQTKSSS
jgi:hypothetical protein